ncbi:MAG: O-phosphoserine--tRNA ligase [Candidatus Helarchaeota archaeon]
MVKFDWRRIQRDSEENYEKTWLETRNLLKISGRSFKPKESGAPHPVFEFIANARKVLLELGYDEVIVPVIVDESAVYKEYGPEAPLILDRIFYLSGLPRPEIGLGKKKIEQIREIIPEFNKFKEFQEIFRRYKKNQIESDDLIEVMVTELEIREEQATSILTEVFPELRNLTPKPTKQTLRSHFTALWFLILAELQYQQSLPIQLFSVGEKFRREQKLDATHLYNSYTLSTVIMAEDFTLEDGKYMARQILKGLGFENVKFEIKKATAKYYAPQTEFEIFFRHPNLNQWIEIGDGGFYSPVPLAKFEIEYPVFNIGFGIERFVMVQQGYNDIRALMYPYFYTQAKLSDAEMVGKIEYEYKPVTDLGKRIMQCVVDAALENKDKNSPLKISIFSEEIEGRMLEVCLWETDPGVKLLGPAILNEIWVVDGNILGLKEGENESGIKTNLSYLKGIAALVGYKAEELVKQRKDSREIIRVKIAKGPSDINLQIDPVVRRYITSNNKKIDIRGPIFFGATILLKS